MNVSERVAPLKKKGALAGEILRRFPSSRETDLSLITFPPGSLEQLASTRRTILPKRSTRFRVDFGGGGGEGFE